MWEAENCKQNEDRKFGKHIMQSEWDRDSLLRFDFLSFLEEEERRGKGTTNTEKVSQWNGFQLGVKVTKGRDDFGGGGDC